MESMNSNVSPIFVKVSPIVPKHLLYKNMRQDLASKLIALGCVQLAIGVICIILNIILLVTAFSFLGFVGHGFWNGAFFIATGIFGIVGGRKKTRCAVVTFSVLSILSACLAAALIVIGALSAAVSISYLSYPNTYYVSYQRYTIGGVALESLLAVLGLVEGIVAIASSAVCCMIGACCCGCGGCCCPPSTDSNQVLAIDPAAFGHLSGAAFNPGQGFNMNNPAVFNPGQRSYPNNPIAVFNSGQEFNPNNQIQQRTFSNQLPMSQYNTSLPDEGVYTEVEDSVPPNGAGNSNVHYTQLQRDHPYTQLRIDPTYN